MENSDAAQLIDEMMDEGAGLVIEASRLDPMFAERLNRHLFAWRSLAQRGFGVSEDGMDALRRYFNRTGE